MIAKEWKELSESEKQVYLDRAAEDRKRYDEQLAEYKSFYGKTYGKNVTEIDLKEDNPNE